MREWKGKGPKLILEVKVRDVVLCCPILGRDVQKAKSWTHEVYFIKEYVSKGVQHLINTI